MSPIFNHHALQGLSTCDLEKLRETLRQSLGQEGLSERERINLHAALASIEIVLGADASVLVEGVTAAAPDAMGAAIIADDTTIMSF